MILIVFSANFFQAIFENRDRSYAFKEMVTLLKILELQYYVKICPYDRFLLNFMQNS
jgi:hypothetical protein